MMVMESRSKNNYSLVSFRNFRRNLLIECIIIAESKVLNQHNLRLHRLRTTEIKSAEEIIRIERKKPTILANNCQLKSKN